MNPLLFRVTSATVIQVTSLEVIVTKSHNSDLLISLTSLAENETDLHTYLLTSSALRRWLRRIDKTNFWRFRRRHHLLFYTVK
jgi:hypothetical protein